MSWTQLYSLCDPADSPPFLILWEERQTRDKDWWEVICLLPSTKPCFWECTCLMDGSVASVPGLPASLSGTLVNVVPSFLPPSSTRGLGLSLLASFDPIIMRAEEQCCHFRQMDGIFP